MTTRFGGGGYRVVIYAPRLTIHPPTTANGINPSCPISLERFHLSLPALSLSFSLSPSPCRFSLSFSLILPFSLSLFHRSFFSFPLAHPLLPSIPPLASRSPIQPSSTGFRPYISPTRHSFLSFHGHGGVSQEHRSEHNIDPAQPTSAYYYHKLRGAASPLVVHRESKDVCVYIRGKFMDALRMISIVAILIN